MRVAVALFGCGLLAGCYLSYGRSEPSGTDGGVTRRDAGPPPPRRDAGPLPDAGPRPDAGPVRHVWRMEPRAVRMSYEGCEARSGATAFVRLSYALGGCERAGPVEVIPPGEDMFEYRVRAYVWVEEGVPCDGAVTEGVRYAEVPATIAGSFLDVRDDFGGGSIRIPLDTAPGTCGPGGGGGEGTMCDAECDCRSDLRCAAVRGDAWCGSICVRPCGDDFDCQIGETCGDETATTTQCQSFMGECFEDSGCPPGQRCVLDRTDCDWAITLSAAARHPCDADEECSPGLHCVETPEGRRSCEVPCWTQQMRCPPMHACRLSEGRAGWPYVCEWLGE